MRHTREILRHKWLLGHGHRLVHSTLGVSHGAITATTQRARLAGLDGDSVCALSDADLEQLLCPPPLPAGTPRPEPDWAHVDLELRKKGVTLDLLSQEHLAQHPDRLRRSAPLRSRASSRTRGAAGGPAALSGWMCRGSRRRGLSRKDSSYRLSGRSRA